MISIKTKVYNVVNNNIVIYNIVYTIFNKLDNYSINNNNKIIYYVLDKCSFIFE